SPRRTTRTRVSATGTATATAPAVSTCTDPRPNGRGAAQPITSAAGDRVAGDRDAGEGPAAAHGDPGDEATAGAGGLAGLLGAGERAAFHGRPAAGVPPLQQAVEVAHANGHDDEATAAAWLRGVALGAAGRYGSALAVLEPMSERASTTHPA